MSIYNSSNALSSIKREAYSHCVFVFVCTAHYRMKLASALTVNECERVRARAASDRASERKKAQTNTNFISLFFVHILCHSTFNTCMINVHLSNFCSHLFTNEQKMLRASQHREKNTQTHRAMCWCALVLFCVMPK